MVKNSLSFNFVLKEIQKKITEVEIEIAEDKIKLGDETMTVANERNKLGKNQLTYV